MRPAFSSTKQAAVFALLLLVLLLLPAVLGKWGLPPREEIYSSIWWANGDFPYIHQQFFHETDTIDIAFVSGSHVWDGIDTPYVQQQLGERLGRPAVVRSLCWGGAGYDAQYFVTQDLLAHRRVRTLVFYDVYSVLDRANTLAPRWFRFGDNKEALAGLPLRLQASYYFASVVGLPRNLLCRLRSNLPADLNSDKKTYWERLINAINPVSRLGALTGRVGFAPDPLAGHAPFTDYTPQTGVQPSEVVVYSPATQAVFDFSGGGIPSWQLHFAQKFAALAREHHCQLVLVHIPAYEERHGQRITEREYWPKALRTELTMVGIPPATLFRGLTDEDIRKLYRDPGHFNQNGQRYFTSLITPTLLQVYDSRRQP